MNLIPIQSIQGPDLFSPVAGSAVRTRGLVIGHTRKGYFLQDVEAVPSPDPDTASSGLFVFNPRRKPEVGSMVDVSGKVVDFAKDENGRPTTQLVEQELELLSTESQSHKLQPVWLTAELIAQPDEYVAALLNNLEGMLVGIEAGATFAAPSNPFGDYVVLPREFPGVRTQQGGLLIDQQQPHRWLPSLRLLDYGRAPQLNVGAELLTPIVGPLNYRSAAFQIAALGAFEVRSPSVELRKTTLRPKGNRVTILTLNGFNLDAHRERASHVEDGRRDVDDDLGDGRFDMLARAIVKDAACPDVVALQEIQDNDGAEMTDVVAADKNYEALISAVLREGGPEYHWADIPPVSGADGGQPGGNIRNGYLFNPKRLELVSGSLRRLGDGSEPFEGSRKPLAARFRLRSTGNTIDIVNVHLASKRHQNSIFAPHQPGFDERLSQRVAQAEIVRTALNELPAGFDYYVTGDFNDYEFSPTLQALIGDQNVNLVDRVDLNERYDYNHRGCSQALMHGVTSKDSLKRRDWEYEILHANALIGVQPGELGDKPSDHAYVIARVDLG